LDRKSLLEIQFPKLKKGFILEFSIGKTH